MPIHDPWEVVWPLSIQEWRSETPTNMYTRTLEWETHNSDRLIWISTVETFNFLFNLLLLDITFPITCYKDTFDNNYRYNAISIGLWSQLFKSQLLEHLSKYLITNLFFFKFEPRLKFETWLKFIRFGLKIVKLLFSFFYLFLC